MDKKEILAAIKNGVGVLSFAGEHPLMRNGGTIIAAGINGVAPKYADTPSAFWDQYSHKPVNRLPNDDEIASIASAFLRGYRHIYIPHGEPSPTEVPRLAITNPQQANYEPLLAAAGYKNVLSFLANGGGGRYLKLWLQAPEDSELFPEVSQPEKKYNARITSLGDFPYCCGAMIVRYAGTTLPGQQPFRRSAPNLGVTEITARNYAALQLLTTTHGMVPLLSWQPKKGLRRLLLVGHLTEERRPFLTLNKEEQK